MQLRMLARRARGHSMTVLGDLAQATGPASPGVVGGDAGAPRPAGECRARRADDRLPAARRDPRSRQPTSPVCRAGGRAGAVGPRRRRPTRLPRVHSRRTRTGGRGARARARKGDGDGCRHRRRRSHRRARARAGGTRGHPRRTGRSVTRTPAGRRPRRAGQGTGVRRGDRRRTSRDRCARTARHPPPVRRAHAAPCNTSRSRTPQPIPPALGQGTMR